MENGGGERRQQAWASGHGSAAAFKRMARESVFNTVKFEQRYKRNGSPKCAHMGHRERTARTKAQMPEAA